VYAIEKFGRERNITMGTLGDLRSMKGAFDLVVCSDVLHYVGERELKQGLSHLERLTEGVAFIEVLTSEDEIVGDVEGLIRRPTAWYREMLTDAGFIQAGPYCWLPRQLHDTAAELERCR
jgi:hypothetical protein